MWQGAINNVIGQNNGVFNQLAISLNHFQLFTSENNRF